MIRMALIPVDVFRWRWSVGALLLIGLLAFVPTTRGGEDMQHPPHADKAMLLEQITELRANVVRLQAALEQNHQTTTQAPSGATGGMRQMQGMSEGMGSTGMMGAMGPKGGQMSPKKPMEPAAMAPAMGSMEGKQGGGTMGMDGMKMMGMRSNMSASSATMSKSAMPGFPGASHLYHVGAAGFFLNHGQHITLTQAQQKSLNRIQERVMLDQATADRLVAEVEQALWVLTGTDEPDAGKIEAKVRQIEKFNGDRRMAFIRAVGEAAAMLTHDQRKTLVGQMQHATTMPAMAVPAEASPSSSSH